MNRSESINELAAALAKAQAEMKAAPKSATNPHFKSKYAPLPEVIDAAKVLHKHGLSFVQPARVDETGGVVVETVLLHSSGQWLAESLTLRAQQNTPQGVGSAITYGRRFGLSSLVGIAADEDDDGNEASKPAPKPHYSAEQQAKKNAELARALEEATTADALTQVASDVKVAHEAGQISDEHREVLKQAYLKKAKPNGKQQEAKA